MTHLIGEKICHGVCRKLVLCCLRKLDINYVTLKPCSISLFIETTFKNTEKDERQIVYDLIISSSLVGRVKTPKGPPHTHPRP